MTLVDVKELMIARRACGRCCVISGKQYVVLVYDLPFCVSSLSATTGLGQCKTYGNWLLCAICDMHYVPTPRVKKVEIQTVSYVEHWFDILLHVTDRRRARSVRATRYGLLSHCVYTGDT